MENKIDISVIILAKNEAEMIAHAIHSVEALSPREVLVIDDNSEDETAKIARKHGAVVISHTLVDFAESHNFGAKKARGSWLLYLDADEQLTAQLADQIRGSITNPALSAYRLRRINYFLGKKWPKEEYFVRLIKKDALTQWVGAVHESAQIKGNIGTIEGAFNHFTHRSLEEMVENTLKWSKTEALLRFNAHHPPIVWWRIPRVMCTAFFSSYIFEGGYRLGTVGLIESIYQAFSMFITYARLWELQQKI